MCLRLPPCYNRYCMKSNGYTFRYIVYQEADEKYTSVCLDLDIVEQGFRSMAEAKQSIEDAITLHMATAAKLGFPKELLHRPAPKIYWDKLKAASRLKKANFRPLSFQLYTPKMPVQQARYA